MLHPEQQSEFAKRAEITKARASQAKATDQDARSCELGSTTRLTAACRAVTEACTRLSGAEEAAAAAVAAGPAAAATAQAVLSQQRMEANSPKLHIHPTKSLTQFGFRMYKVPESPELERTSWVHAEHLFVGPAWHSWTGLQALDLTLHLVYHTHVTKAPYSLPKLDVQSAEAGFLSQILSHAPSRPSFRTKLRNFESRKAWREQTAVKPRLLLGNFCVSRTFCRIELLLRQGRLEQRKPSDISGLKAAPPLKCRLTPKPRIAKA